MLISHHHRFIFVKPRKTAGTTAELALSPFLEPGDHATPIQAEEEPLRRVRAGVTVGVLHGRSRLGWPLRLRDHSPLSRAEALLGASIAGYRVVSMVRNPWDRAVSQFFWSLRHTDIRTRPRAVQAAAFRSFTRRWGPMCWRARFVGRRRQRTLDNASLYVVAGRCRAGFLIRFERLGPDLAALQDWLGLPGRPVASVHTKGGLRGDGGDWRSLYDRPTRDLVARVCAREIALGGYAFERDAPRLGPVLDLPGPTGRSRPRRPGPAGLAS